MRYARVNWTESVGDFCYGRKGGYYFWEARGRAREIYDTVLGSEVADVIESIRELITGVRLTLCMVGSTKERSLPTIVIAGGTKQGRKIALEAIRELLLTAESSGFETANLPRFPPTGHWYARAGDGSMAGADPQSDLYYAPGSRWVGLPVQVWTVGQDVATKATCGGIIQAGAEFYYLTTAHAFRRGLFSYYEADSEGSDDEFEIHGQAVQPSLDDITSELVRRGSTTPESVHSNQTYRSRGEWGNF